MTATIDRVTDRSLSLGASDSAAAVGLSRWKSPLALYLEKTGALPPPEENDAMAVGKALEAGVLSLFTRRTGLRVINQQQRLTHPSLPWLTCTLDGQTEDGELVEAKTASWRMRDDWGEEGTDQIPTEYLCQCMHQLAVSGRELVRVPVLLGGEELRVYQVRRSDKLLALLLAKEEAFWRLIESSTPPPPDWEHAGTKYLIEALHPLQESEVTLSDEKHLKLLDSYLGWREERSKSEKFADEFKARIIEAAGGAALIRFADGRTVTRREVQVKEHVRKASSYVNFTVREPKK